MTDAEVATAETRRPSVSAASTQASIFSLPYMSPRRPTIGMATDALSSYAVSSHVTVDDEVCKCKACSRVGSAGRIRDWRRPYAIAATARTANVEP
jgi:hypothetical protein